MFKKRKSESLDHHREWFLRSADAILIMDDETFVDCNDAAVRMFRYETREQLLKTAPSDLLPEYQPDGCLSSEKSKEMVDHALKEGSCRFAWDCQRADGELFPVEVLLTPVPEGDRTVIHAVWRDVTERKDLELQLRCAQKMEAVGKLAGGVAHEFNNILVSILGYADLLGKQLANSPKLLEQVRAIQAGGEQAAVLIRQLRTFGQDLDLKPEVVKLSRIVDDMDSMIRRLVGEQIRTVVQHESDTGLVKVDSGQMEQVLLHLATNARDAMPDGGNLTISTYRTTIGPESGMELNAGEYTCLQVEDTGCGMAPELAARAFEPFYTTKDAAGLGLANVYGVIKQSGGDLRMKTRPDGGTSLELFLPECADPSVMQEPVSVRQDQDPGFVPVTDEGPVSEEVQVVDGDRQKPGVGTVLVVEDEPAVAGLVKQALELEGFEVLEARNGAAALRLFRKDGKDVDLVLSDVIMPVMNGPELVKQIQENRPDLPALFMSGYTDDVLSRHGFLIENICLLRKPFSSAQLVDKVRQAM